MSQIIMQVTNLLKDLTFNTKINPKKEKKETKISDIRTSKGPKNLIIKLRKLLKLSKKKKYDCKTEEKKKER